jgi:hypothetical protein
MEPCYGPARPIRGSQKGHVPIILARLRLQVPLTVPDFSSGCRHVDQGQGPKQANNRVPFHPDPATPITNHHQPSPSPPITNPPPMPPSSSLPSTPHPRNPFPNTPSTTTTSQPPQRHQPQPDHAHHVLGIITHTHSRTTTTANPDDRAVVSAALRSLAVVSAALVDRREQAEVLDVLERIAGETGWRLGRVVEGLRAGWGWDSASSSLNGGLGGTGGTGGLVALGRLAGGGGSVGGGGGAGVRSGREGGGGGHGRGVSDWG